MVDGDYGLKHTARGGDCLRVSLLDDRKTVCYQPHVQVGKLHSHRAVLVCVRIQQVKLTWSHLLVQAEAAETLSCS